MADEVLPSFSVAEFAERWGVTAAAVRGWIAKGMPHTRKSRVRRTVFRVPHRVADGWVQEERDAGRIRARARKDASE